MIKYAIENETQLRLHYVRSTGEAVDHVIEPEAFQGKRVYAFCPDLDEHHLYALERISTASI